MPKPSYAIYISQFLLWCNLEDMIYIYIGNLEDMIYDSTFKSEDNFY